MRQPQDIIRPHLLIGNFVFWEPPRRHFFCFLWFARESRRNKHVHDQRVSEHVACERDGATRLDIMHLHTDFFRDFADGSLLYRLARLDIATKTVPAASAELALLLAKEDALLIENHTKRLGANGHADLFSLRVFVFYGYLLILTASSLLMNDDQNVPVTWKQKTGALSVAAALIFSPPLFVALYDILFGEGRTPYKALFNAVLATGAINFATTQIAYPSIFWQNEVYTDGTTRIVQIDSRHSDRSKYKRGLESVFTSYPTIRPFVNDRVYNKTRIDIRPFENRSAVSCRYEFEGTHTIETLPALAEASTARTDAGSSGPAADRRFLACEQAYATLLVSERI